MNYSDVEKQILDILEKAPFCVLATANKQGVISADQMCLVNDGLKVYIQTDSTFEKIKNIEENPNIALNVGAYSFKGVATIVGHPSTRPIFIEKIKQKHQSTFKEYTNLPNEVLIEIELNQCKIWGKAGLEENSITKVDLKNKRIELIKCDSM